MYTRYLELPIIKSLFAKATPAEKAQITGFVRANTEPPRIHKPFGFWSLIRMTHLGTGREFLTVSLGLKKPGVSANDMREAIGLPRIGVGKSPTAPPVPGKKRITKGGRTRA